MPIPPSSTPQAQAQTSIRRSAPALAGGVAGASLVALLAVSSVVAPVLAGGASLTTLLAWLGGLGGNALADWLTEWAASRLAQFDGDAPDRERRLLEQLARDLTPLLAQRADFAEAAELLIVQTDAVAVALGALTGQADKQARLLRTLLEDLQQATFRNERLHEATLQTVATSTRQLLVAQGQGQADLKGQLDTLLVAVVRLEATVRQAPPSGGVAVAGDAGVVQVPHISGGTVGSIVGQQFNYVLPAQTTGTISLDDALALFTRMPLDVVPPPANLPAVSSRLYPDNPHFVGRTDELRQIAAALAAQQTIAVTGMGGMGKSSLAVAFAHRYGQYFAGGVFWLSCADPTQIEYAVAACGGRGLVERADWGELKLPDQVRLVCAAWAAPTPRLLIFDNCEDAALLKVWRPASGGCRVLVTSRQGDWQLANAGMRTLPLTVLPPTASMALLGQHRPDLVGHPALDALADEVGDLPLALHLVGSYLATYRHDPAFGDPATFLAELRALNLLAHEALQGVDVSDSPTDHALSVATTFTMSLNRLDLSNATDTAARALLARAALLAPGEPIPRTVLLATLAPNADDPAAQKQAIRALKRLHGLGLLEASDGHAPWLHRLLATYARQYCPDPDATKAVEDAVRAAYDARRDTADYLAPLDDLLLHLRHVTETALRRDDEQAALLANRLGYYLNQIADYTAARPLLEQALAIHEQTLGPMHPNTASSLNNLAELLKTQGDYAAAQPLYERALAIKEQALGPTHPDTARSLNNLAVLLDTMGDYIAARPLYERALAIKEQALASTHPDTALSLNNLAGLLSAMGDYASARPLLERALDIHEQALGPMHPHTASSLNNLAELFYRLNDYASARPLCERALAITEQALGLTHPHTASSLNSLALLLKTQGNYTAARPLFERALAINEETLGPMHPNTQTARRNLAALDAAQHDNG